MENGAIERVSSSIFLMAARNKETGEKFMIPSLDLDHSESVNIAGQRAQLAKEAKAHAYANRN
jgi:hypothetical protein